MPATSANLGPGFDALGLALGLHNEVILEEADRISVGVEGEGAGRLDDDAKNVVARGVALGFEVAGRPFRGARLRCVNRIPLSRGLGSSAAAWVGGLVAANAVLGEPLDRDALVTAAARAEGHPDNVAAAVLGGLTVSCADGARVTAVSLPVPREIVWVVLVPETESSTREARAVLPDSVPRADAVFNVQRVSLLLAGLGGGRPDLLDLAMQDRLHQPYRQRLFPWMEAVADAGRRAGALGCVLSGAGPSMLAAVRGRGDDVGRAMERALREAGIEGRALSLPVDAAGATWERLPET
ncbi:MAG TPA: homoserine kinase [Candidatus Eisenbacteria bacterium]|nr:homoserine kinase [Candidatus Eisenbacteria bacterium]